MGAFEAGFFPAAVLIMNKWYLKFELSARVAIYYAGAAISGAFSGLLAYALAKMDGIAGVAGWRYIQKSRGAKKNCSSNVRQMDLHHRRHHHRRLRPSRPGHPDRHARTTQSMADGRRKTVLRAASEGRAIRPDPE